LLNMNIEQESNIKKKIDWGSGHLFFNWIDSILSIKQFKPA
jgi:hypothetical protein